MLLVISLYSALSFSNEHWIHSFCSLAVVAGIPCHAIHVVAAAILLLSSGTAGIFQFRFGWQTVLLAGLGVELLNIFFGTSVI
jgi:hypothetical protein